MDATHQPPALYRFAEQRRRLLMLELEVAMTFVDIARTAPIPESLAGKLENAWKAYCSICEMVGDGADCPPEDKARIERMSDALGRTLLDWLNGTAAPRAG
jgi:hypothetical protein